jgi:uncharacterized protein YndB with AHSA1/START domain
MTQETSQQTQTLQLHRHFTAPPERVYKAFLDPDALAKWNAPHGFVAKVHQHDAKVGGTFRMSFRNFGTGTEHTFGGKFLELTEFTRLRWTDAFEDQPELEGTMTVTVDLEPSSIGTFVTITQEGLPAAMPIEFATAGWQESLVLLAQLVEPEIPDGPIEG